MAKLQKLKLCFSASQAVDILAPSRRSLSTTDKRESSSPLESYLRLKLYPVVAPAHRPLQRSRQRSVPLSASSCYIRPAFPSISVAPAPLWSSSPLLFPPHDGATTKSRSMAYLKQFSQ